MEGARQQHLQPWAGSQFPPVPEEVAEPSHVTVSAQLKMQPLFSPWVQVAKMTLYILQQRSDTSLQPCPHSTCLRLQTPAVPHIHLPALPRKEHLIAGASWKGTQPHPLSPHPLSPLHLRLNEHKLLGAPGSHLLTQLKHNTDLTGRSLLMRGTSASCEHITFCRRLWELRLPVLGETALMSW